MSDARIHLLLSYHSTSPDHPPFDQWINVCIAYPTLEEKNYLRMIFYDIENKIKGVEALVRSLTASDSREIDVCYCNQCHGKIFWTESTKFLRIIEKIETTIASNCLCGQGLHISNLKEPLTYTRKKEREYDSKLKVTFGSGTWGIEVATNQTDPKQPIKEIKPLGKVIIEPLQPIFTLCQELGIQLFYQN